MVFIVAGVVTILTKFSAIRAGECPAHRPRIAPVMSSEKPIHSLPLGQKTRNPNAAAMAINSRVMWMRPYLTSAASSSAVGVSEMTCP